MILVRCPTCATVFRVTADQLKARQGMVRCGRCGTAFNTLDALVEAPAEPQAKSGPAPTAIEESPPQPATLPPAAPAETESPPPESPPASAAADTPAWQRHRPLLGWGAAVLFASGLALVQTAYVFRSELAHSFPASRPLLERLCAGFNCRIALPRQAELLSIEASDLQPDPQHRDWLVLAATLRNRAEFAQSFPHLELTLTDARDQPLVRRVFPPREYLNAGAVASAGFAANGEQTVQLVLNAGGIGASGYRLYLFYP